MKQIFWGLCISLMVAIMMIAPAEAKRFGGGKSIGYQRSMTHTTPRATSVAANAAKPASTASKWLGPLAGLAIGGLLASLFMGHGLGSGIMSWLLILGTLFILWRVINYFRQGGKSHTAAFQGASQRAPINAPLYEVPETSAATTTPANVIPADFDETAFLRGAKTLFIRLQTAYDTKNLDDIREFTSPEMFAEIQMQLQERGAEENMTEVLYIDARLLEAGLESDKLIASAEFTGTIRETAGGDGVNVKEIWHFEKIKFSPNWKVIGIQQE